MVVVVVDDDDDDDDVVVVDDDDDDEEEQGDGDGVGDDYEDNDGDDDDGDDDDHVCINICAGDPIWSLFMHRLGTKDWLGEERRLNTSGDLGLDTVSMRVNIGE